MSDSNFHAYEEFLRRGNDSATFAERKFFSTLACWCRRDVILTSERMSDVEAVFKSINLRGHDSPCDELKTTARELAVLINSTAL